MPYVIETYSHWPITLADATPTSAGVMSAADKAKLDSLIPGGGTTLAQTYLNGANPVDSTMIVDNLRGPVSVDASLTVAGPGGEGLLLVKDNTGGASNIPVLSLQNTTTPGLNSAEYSPSLRFEGRSDVAGNENLVSFFVQDQPVGGDGSGAGGARGTFVIGYQQGSIGGPYSSGALLSLDSANPGILTLGGVPVDLNGAALNDVLTFDGTKFAPAPGSGGGGIGGTIAANEVAFGTGLNTVGGDSRFTWNAGTGVFELSSPGGQFIVIDTSTLGFQVKSPAPATEFTNVNPGSVYANNGAVPTPLSVGIDSNGPGGVPSIVSVNSPLNIQTNAFELQINTNPGAAGEVLTSQGAGLPPVWAAGGGGGIGGTISLNRIAFGTALNTIGGDAGFTWNGATGVFEIADASPFFTADRSTHTVSVQNGGAPTKSVTLTESVVAVTDGATDVQLLTAAGRGVIGTTSVPLNLSLPVELQVNNVPGSAGEVLTSQGAGLPPIWAPGGGGGGVTAVTASAPLASSGGATPDISLGVSGVVAASYTNASVTVDVYGRVTAASSGTAPVLLTIGEIPGGLVNGANTVFTTAVNFVSNTTAVYVNGVRQLRGAGNDYTETGANQITFAVAPLAGFQLQLDYYPA